MIIDDLRAGDVLAVPPRGILGRGISAVTHYGVSHVAIYTGEGFCFEENGFFAVGGIPVTKYLEVTGTHVLRLREEFQVKVKGIMKYLGEHYGELYDYVEILELFIKYEFNLDIGYDSEDVATCSALIARALFENGIDAFPGMKLDEIVPGDYLSSPVFYTIGIV